MKKEIEPPASCQTDVISCSSSSSGGISKVYLLNAKDCVFKDGVLVRLKRKYGKYKREVVVVDYDKS